jgi:hypothetical protein
MSISGLRLRSFVKSYFMEDMMFDLKTLGIVFSLVLFSACNGSGGGGSSSGI